jgi:hypothetical protein
MNQPSDDAFRDVFGRPDPDRETGTQPERRSFFKANTESPRSRATSKIPAAVFRLSCNRLRFLGQPYGRDLTWLRRSNFLDKLPAYRHGQFVDIGDRLREGPGASDNASILVARVTRTEGIVRGIG